MKMLCLFRHFLTLSSLFLSFHYSQSIQESFIDLEKKENGPLPSCRWNYKYDVAKSIIAGICFLMGFFILLYGYKRRRISFCFTGLTSVSILTYMIIASEAKFSLLINILISLAAGLFASLFTTMLLYCGYFITGLFAGFTIGFIFLLVYTSFLPLNSVALPSVIVALFGLGQVFITMWWRHRVYIFSSCVVSSAVMASALDYFVEDLFLFRYIEMKIFYNRVSELCWWSYVILGIWPLCFLIGILVQCLITGREKQKEEYAFRYQLRSTRRPVRDDESHLIRHNPDRFSLEN